MKRSSIYHLSKLSLTLAVCGLAFDANASPAAGMVGKPIGLLNKAPLELAVEERAFTNSLAMEVKGKVLESTGDPLPGVTVMIKGTTLGTVTDIEGNYALTIPDEHEDAILVFSFIGFKTVEVFAGNQTLINVTLEEDLQTLEEVVVVGYGEQKKGSVTGSIGTVSADDITDVPAPTISQALIGKVAGISTRVTDGRPGSAAKMQIRNMGTPLYVIDGVQSGEGNFNQLGPDDIESISILKDAAAAIYGLRASNGVVLVTTKKGKLNQENKVNVNTYYGWQSLTRFPKPASAGDYVRALAEADINQNGSTVWTPEEVAKWEAGTEDGYRGFDWTDYVRENVPQKYFNINTSGGSKKTNYYLSMSHLDQDAVFEGYNFNRTNLQTNVETRIGERLKVGIRLNGKIEERDIPGLVGGDNYWQALLGTMRNKPTERPYANDNPLYPATIENYASNHAVFEYSGYANDLWRSLQTSFDLEYKLPVEGLTATAMYAFFYNNGLHNESEKTYNTYTYNESTDIYEVTGGQANPYRTRRNIHITDNIFRGQLDYKRQFGVHNVSAMIGVEAQERLDKNFFVHAQPATNHIDLINQVNEVRNVSDAINESARAGFIFRANYDFKDKYLLEIAGRYDGSWLFPPGHRWGLFPSVSAGWRITEEAFMRNGSITNVLDDLKLRVSYGEMGREPTGEINPYDYLGGYNWGAGSSVLDDALITGAEAREMPVKTLSWINTSMTNIGIDFSLWNGRLSGSVDGFYRKLAGVPGRRYDVQIPTEVDILLPPENLAASATKGIEGALSYMNQIGQIKFSVGANATFARNKNLYTYKPRFGSSWDYYRNSTEERWEGINWGYEYIGQFQSEEEIANYPVDIDGQNNATLLPGDFKYRDINNDGVINGLDSRPNGFGGELPYLTYGLHASVGYKGIDFSASFAGATLQSRSRNAEIKNPFQGGGNSPDFLLNDRWHKEDIFNPDSPWVPGKYPALRKSPVPNNNAGSDFWFTNITYLRLRNVQLGYTLPENLLSRFGFSKVRLYVNGTNLFSLDNTKEFGVDPETIRGNGLDYPTHRVINVGANITF